jgi:hypothetical protein
MRPAHRPRSKSTHKTVQPSFPKRIFLFLTLIILGIFAGIVWYIWFVPAEWGRETSKNIVLVSSNMDESIDNILYLSISYKKNTLEAHSIPATETVRVPGGYGEYPLKSVLSLLALDKKKNAVVVPTYSYIVGVPIDEVWTVANKKIFESIEQPNEFAKAILWGKIGTGLGLKDRFQLYQFFRQQQPSVSQFSSLESWREKQSQHLPDAWKNCRLTIVNTTPVIGLGGRVGRVLERGGAIVVRLTDQGNVQPKSQFIVQPGLIACQDLREHLQGLFPTEIEYREDQDILNRTRSEAELTLGEDLGKFLQE